MNYIFNKIVKLKKKFLPTKYDNYLKQLHKDRLNFYSQFIASGDLCFDIGANIGNRTQVFLELGAKVIAIEPQRSCTTILEKKFGNKITLIKKGVGSKNEIKDFYISNENQVSTFSKDWIDAVKQNRFKNTEWNKVEQIEIVTIDSLIPETLIPTFIKIDVEGFELEVFKGLTKKFRYLSFEYTVPERGKELNECLQLLSINFKHIIVNYSIQENSRLELLNWISVDDFIKQISPSPYFINSKAGDIYIKTINQ